MGMINNRALKVAAILVAVTAFTAVVGVAVSAQMGPRRGAGDGQGPGGPGMMGRGGFGMRGGPGGPGGMMLPLRQLNLTDAQQGLVRTIMESNKDAMKTIGDRLQAAHKALNDAVAADTLDEAAVRARAAELSAVDADAAVQRAKVYAAVFAILTPEQQQKAKALRTDMEKRMKDGVGRMGGRGGRGRGGRGRGGPGVA